MLPNDRLWSSRRVRFAPRADIRPMPAFMSTRPYSDWDLVLNERVRIRALTPEDFRRLQSILYPARSGPGATLLADALYIVGDAAEFVRLKVDAIVTNAFAALTVKQATEVIPIVFPLGISLTCASVRQVRARDHLGDIDQPLFWCKWRRDGYRPCASRRATRIAHRKRAITALMAPPIYCAAMLLARMTSPQSLISRLSSELAASGVCWSGGNSSMPPSSNVLRTVASASAWRSAALSRSTIGPGVPEGANRMCQNPRSSFL